MKTVLAHASSSPYSVYVRLLVVALCAATSVPAIAGDKVNLEINSKRGFQQKVNARFEHDGKVVVDQAGQKETPDSLAMKTVADLAYYQRSTGSDKDPQAIRYFASSHGNFNIDKGKSSASLGKDNRMIVARLKSVPGQRLQMASVVSMLDQSELELIKNPADPLTYRRLLEKSSVAEGDKWEVDKEALADFLLVDRVLFTDARLMLKTATSTKARVYLMGQVDATIDDVGTSMKVSAIFDIDMKRKMVTDVRLSVNENRQAGQIAPGFEGKSRIDIQLIADSSCKYLTPDALKKITKSRRIKQRLQWKPNEEKFALEYDPRWRMIASESEAAVLRYVDDGDLLAQCNIVQLPSRPATNPLTLDGYKKEVQKIIKGDKNAALIDAKKLTTATGLDALRVAFKGIEGGVPVQWIYYHVAADDGRRLTFVFTLEEEIASIFQPSDQRMVNGLSFYIAPKSGSTNVASKSQRRSAAGSRSPSKTR